MDVVCSYPNPDTDGVVCAIAVAELERRIDGISRLPVMTGQLGIETRAVLDALGAARPVSLPWFGDVRTVILVDTHHLEQLPQGLPAERVTHVFDHHPGGDPQAFPNAAIQNEAVGSVATLLAERYHRFRLECAPLVVQLMQAAILSNTLGLAAPSTSARDREAIQCLERIAPLPTDVIKEMGQARIRLLQAPSEEILARNVKVFVFGGRRVAMTQVEAPNAAWMANRPDFMLALESLRAATSSDLVVANLADTAVGASLLCSPDPNVWTVLGPALAVQAVHGRAWASGLVLRKTHLVPAFQTAG